MTYTEIFSTYECRKKSFPEVNSMKVKLCKLEKQNVYRKINKFSKFNFLIPQTYD